MAALRPNHRPKLLGDQIFRSLIGECPFSKHWWIDHQRVKFTTCRPETTTSLKTIIMMGSIIVNRVDIELRAGGRDIQFGHKSPCKAPSGNTTPPETINSMIHNQNSIIRNLVNYCQSIPRTKIVALMYITAGILSAYRSPTIIQ